MPNRGGFEHDTVSNEFMSKVHHAVKLANHKLASLREVIAA